MSNTMTRPLEKVIQFVREPRGHLSWWKQRFERTVLQRELIRAARRKLRPRKLTGDPELEVHVLIGRSRTGDCIWALESLYRFMEPYPLVVHDDGTLGSSEVTLLENLFSGCRVIRRERANAAVSEEFRRRNLPECADYWRNNTMGRKLFDLQLFSAGRRLVFLDSDILFFEQPTELLDAAQAPLDRWTDRYNVDIEDWYGWPRELLEGRTGLKVPSKVNAGLMVVRRGELDWSFYEECLLRAGPPLSAFHVEQTLWALDFARGGAEPLPERYDVHHRYAWEGEDREEALRAGRHGRQVISQHYSGGWSYRRLFYDMLRNHFF